MNTRKSIQTTTDPNVLGISFSGSRKRFIASLSEGTRVFRTDNCTTTCQPSLGRIDDILSAVAISAVLDDRYIAYVLRTSTITGTGHVLVFWDCLLDKEVNRFDLYEPILGIRLCQKWMVVLLRERTVVFSFQELEPLPDIGNETKRRSDAAVYGPNKVHGVCPTASNVYALATLREDLLVLPAQATGQVQLVPLPNGSKRVIRAHNTALRQFDISQDGKLLATSSEQGTLIRVFDTKSTDQVAEFRRGVEKAIVYSLCFSPGNRWLASTSDKGTLHVFDLQASGPSGETGASSPVAQSQAASKSRGRHPSIASNRLSGGADKDSTSGTSARSSYGAHASAAASAITTAGPHAGSVQEYYGLRPVLSPSAAATGRETAASALSALRSAGWAPKVLRDVRSVASAPFWTGSDGEGARWQARSGSAYTWTTAPSGTRVRVPKPVPPLPNDPSGRPPKGVLAFAPVEADDNGEESAVIYVLGGGIEGRWEMFDFVRSRHHTGAYVLALRGFRRFLSRQFVD